MTADEFRALENITGNGHSAHPKTDDLLAAAVAGFASLTRPNRYESQQLQDLTLPLLETTSARARRQVSAVLAQHEIAPRNLILALANDEIEVAAPLLLRSPILKSSDLMDIIAAHGLHHARIIARRHPVDPLLLPVLNSFDDPIIEQSLLAPPLTTAVAEAETAEHIQQPAPAENIVQAVQPTEPVQNISALTYAKNLRPTLAEYLIDMSLLVDSTMFRMALAEVLEISFERAGNIIGHWPDSQLPLALKALGLTAQDTYLILTASLGTIHGERDQLREFVHIYRSISTEQAMAMVKRWKADDNNDRLRDKLRNLAETQGQEFTSAANSDDSFKHQKAQ